VLAEDRRTDEAEDPLALEYRMFDRNGRVVRLREEAMLVRGEEGHPLHWQGFMLDVTERKKAEERLNRSEGLEVGLEEALGDERRPLGHAR